MASYPRLVAGWKDTIPSSFFSCLARGYAAAGGDARIGSWRFHYSTWRSLSFSSQQSSLSLSECDRPRMLKCDTGRKWRTELALSRQRQSIWCCRVEEAPVASDVSYGGKEVVQVTDALYSYILDHTREPDILRQLREETSTIHGSSMQVSPEQAQLLAMLVQIMGAQRCIEVGVFTGYSSLAVALALPDSGRLVACERCELHLGTALKYYHLAGVSHKVTAKCGLALDTLRQLLEDGGAESYDFSFVDADKRNNPQYYELLLRLVRPGGLIVIDNVLWHGKVADPQVNDFKTHCIRKFNQQLLFDKRVSISMVPIGDGMTICRKH